MKDILIPRPANDSAYHDTKVTRFKKSINDSTSWIVMSENELFNMRLHRIDVSFWVIRKFKNLFLYYINSEDSKRDDPNYWKSDEEILSTCKEYSIWKMENSDILENECMQESIKYAEIRFKEVLDILSWKLIVWNTWMLEKDELYRTIKKLEEAA